MNHEMDQKLSPIFRCFDPDEIPIFPLYCVPGCPVKSKNLQRPRERPNRDGTGKGPVGTTLENNASIYVRLLSAEKKRHRRWLPKGICRENGRRKGPYLPDGRERRTSRSGRRTGLVNHAAGFRQQKKSHSRQDNR